MLLGELFKRHSNTCQLRLLNTSSGRDPLGHLSKSGREHPAHYCHPCYTSLLCSIALIALSASWACSRYRVGGFQLAEYAEAILNITTAPTEAQAATPGSRGIT